jgi:hypothetical protein
MSSLFADPFHQDFANIAVGAISVCAADAGEVATAAERTTAGDDESFYAAWVAAADAVIAEAGGLEPGAARQADLRAAVCYSIAWHPFLGPTANEAFGRETQALAQAATRVEPALEAVSIPFADHDMPGYFVPASGHPAGTRRPLLIWTNGYDGKLEARGVGADQASHLDALPDDVISLIVAGGTQTRDGRWRLEQRGPFVHGVATAAEAVRAMAEYSMEGHCEQITCPTLLTAAEDDPLSALAADFAQRLGDRSHLMHFTAAEGAGDHCELLNRPLANQRMLDWLDATLPG